MSFSTENLFLPECHWPDFLSWIQPHILSYCVSIFSIHLNSSSVLLISSSWHLSLEFQIRLHENCLACLTPTSGQPQCCHIKISHHQHPDDPLLPTPELDLFYGPLVFILAIPSYFADATSWEKVKFWNF